jgi:very-short-patch-repair endonuclease
VRQEPIGPFIGDFASREARLIVEVDGATHASDEESGYDRRRDAYFRASGYRVLSVGNDEVYHRLNDVLETILAALEGSR